MRYLSSTMILLVLAIVCLCVASYQRDEAYKRVAELEQENSFLLEIVNKNERKRL